MEDVPSEEDVCVVSPVKQKKKRSVEVPQEILDGIREFRDQQDAQIVQSVPTFPIETREELVQDKKDLEKKDTNQLNGFKEKLSAVKEGGKLYRERLQRYDKLLDRFEKMADTKEQILQMQLAVLSRYSNE